MFTSKKYNWTFYLLGWLIVSVVACCFRLYPLNNFHSSENTEKASIYVISKLRQAAAQHVHQNFPQANSSQKSILVKQHFDKLLKDDPKKVQMAINEMAQSLDNESSTQKSTPYLLASDSFYYYNLTENIKNTGSISDTIKGSKYLNPLMVAPDGQWEPLNIHPYIGYWVYKVTDLFQKNTKLMFAVSFTPLVITVLALFCFIGICRNLNIHPVITVTSSIFLALAPIFIRRSTFGWYDNDPYNVLFPLAIFWILLVCIDLINNQASSSKTRIQKLSAAGCALFLSIFLYSLFWHGWMMMFVVIFVSLVLTCTYYWLAVKNNSTIFLSLYLSSIFFIGVFVSISIFFGLDQFFTLFKEGWQALTSFMTPQLSSWPDLYITVGELGKSDFGKIAEQVGGNLSVQICVLGIVAALIILLNKRILYLDKTNIHPAKIIVILVCLAATTLITIGAERFSILILTPLYILFAIGLQSAYVIVKHQTFAKQPITTILSLVFLILVTVANIFPLHFIQANIQKYLNPIYNDTWNDAMIHLRDNTPPHSIVNTWWPPGHFIKAIAKRKVSFDGASINNPQGYWIANALLSRSEEEAIGIIRMLNNSGNDAVKYLSQDMNIPLSTSVFLLKQITQVNELKARVLLAQLINDRKHIDAIIRMTHAQPPPSYLFIYNEIIEKNALLSFTGNWNFRRIEEINNNPKLITKVPQPNTQEYINFLWELSGGQPRYSGILPFLTKQNNKLLFKENVTINLKTMSCIISSNKFGKGVPQSIFYMDKGKVIEKKLVGANLSYSVIYSEVDKKPVIALMDQDLAKSVLMQLYFFRGKNYKYIKPFYETANLTKRTEIMIYQIDWQAYHSDFLKDISNLTDGN